MSTDDSGDIRLRVHLHFAVLSCTEKQKKKQDEYYDEIMTPACVDRHTGRTTMFMYRVTEMMSVDYDHLSLLQNDTKVAHI